MILAVVFEILQPITKLSSACSGSETLHCIIFLASQDALEVMRVSEWVSEWVNVLIDFTDMTLVSEDTYQRPPWCKSYLVMKVKRSDGLWRFACGNIYSWCLSDRQSMKWTLNSDLLYQEIQRYPQSLYHCSSGHILVVQILSKLLLSLWSRFPCSDNNLIFILLLV